MSNSKQKPTLTLPKTTKVFICARCGVASLYANGLCDPKEGETKESWCEKELIYAYETCQGLKKGIRYKCKKCNQVAVNSELLCEPEKL